MTGVSIPLFRAALYTKPLPTGKDNQCFLCGVSPLPSALHLPPPSEGAAECVASDACVADHVPRTAQGALESAEAAAPEPLLLPPHVKHSLPLMVRACVFGVSKK